MKRPAAKVAVRPRPRAINAMGRTMEAMGEEVTEIGEVGDTNKGRENHHARQIVGRRHGVPRACDARSYGQYLRSMNGVEKSLSQT